MLHLQCIIGERRGHSSCLWDWDGILDSFSLSTLRFLLLAIQFEGSCYFDHALTRACSISCATFDAFNIFLEWVVLAVFYNSLPWRFLVCWPLRFTWVSASSLSRVWRELHKDFVGLRKPSRGNQTQLLLPSECPGGPSLLWWSNRWRVTFGTWHAIELYTTSNVLGFFI